MKSNLQKSILERISKENLGAFTSTDFLDLASYDAIRKSLDRLEDSKKIRRVIRGVYDKPSLNKTFNMFESPKIEDIAYAIARQNNWSICPTGNYALNK